MTNPLNTNPSLPEDDAGLVERLRKVEPTGFFKTGSEGIYCGDADRAAAYGGKLITRLRNPDGPEAADRIQSLSTALAEAREKAIRDCINAVASAELPKAHWSCGLDEGGMSLNLGRQRRYSIKAIRSLTLPEGGE